MKIDIEKISVELTEYVMNRVDDIGIESDYDGDGGYSTVLDSSTRYSVDTIIEEFLDD
jgi:hypothetical protein